MAKKANEIQNGDVKRNIITLRNVLGKADKVLVQPAVNKYGRLADCVRKVDSNGDMILSVEDKQKTGTIFIPETQWFELVDGTTFDLDDDYQRCCWEAIKDCILIAPSRDAKDNNGNYLIDGTINNTTAALPRYGVAVMYVEHPGSHAQSKVSRVKLVHQAQTFVLNDERGYDGHLLIAKVLGRNMINQPSADVEEYLLSVAQEQPEKIIELYTGGDLQLKLLLISAKEKRVIYKDHGLYLYGEDTPITLGATDVAVIEWMKQPKNQKSLQLIRQETYPEMYNDDDN